jgi:hypothetical protein
MVLSVKQITEAREKPFTSSLNISSKEKWTEGRGVMPPLSPPPSLPAVLEFVNNLWGLGTE